MRRLFVLLASLMAMGLSIAKTAHAEDRIKVVTTLSTFADLARTIGGDHVDVSAIASPKFDPHFIEPRPSDVLKTKRAQLFIHAGLDLEAWRGPLLDAAGNRKIFPGQPAELDLSRGISLLEVPDRAISRAEGDIHLYGNPHYWVDPKNGRQMAEAIAEKLADMDPAHAPEYRKHAADFLARLDAQLPQWKSRLSPFQGKELVGYHNAWPYLMHFSGLLMQQFLEPKPGIPPTPKQVEFLTQYMLQHGIKGIVQSSYASRNAAEALAKRTGASVIVLCQNVGELPACGDYIAMTDYNINALSVALSE